MGAKKKSNRHGKARKALGGIARRTGIAKRVGRSDLGQRARIRYPGPAQHDQIQVGVEWALLAMSEGNWQEAIRRWKRLLDRFGPSVSSRVYKGLASAYIEMKQFGVAAAVVERGRALFPHALDLPLLWAHIATVEKDWDETIERYRKILKNAGPTASWRPHKGLVTAYLELGDLRSAFAAADEGMHHFPDNIDIAGAWAGVPLEAEDWPQAVARWEYVVDRFGSAAPWRAYANLSLSYGKTGNFEMAVDVIEQGRSQFPGEVTLVADAAELAMARRDWIDAVDRWQEVLELRVKARPAALRGETLPRRGRVWDWYEEAWQRIAQDWNRIEPNLVVKPSPLLFRSLARSMKLAQLPDESLTMLQIGTATYPDEGWLDFDLAVANLEVRNIDGRVAPKQITVGSDERHRRAERFVASIHRDRPDTAQVGEAPPGDVADSGVVVCAKNAETLAQFHPSLGPSTDGLGPIHVIRVPAGSSVELQLKAGRYFSPSAIEHRVAEVSQRDQWGEMTSPSNLLMQRARTTADAFASRFEDPPFLTASSLSDAAISLLFYELVVYEPMRRIAADIAAENDDSPVFIESPVDSYRYLDGDPFTHFDVLFLYFELRRRGVNAFLCRPLSGVLHAVAPLRFTPGARSLLPQMKVNGSPSVETNRAVFPAGIRSVRRVNDLLGDTIVFSSGSVVQEFAYDRSLKWVFPIDPVASVHPSATVLPRLQFPMVPTGVLNGVPLIPEVGLEVDARIDSSGPIGHDWLFWLDHVLHDYLKEISMRSFAEVGGRGITEAHIADLLLPDAALFGDAVKRSGGRVVLWPHSTNPVHVDQRRRGSFDEVHAVTRTGCEQWRARFPDADVRHSPSVMLDPASRDTTIDPDLPLSVVVIGGRTLLRYTPELDQALHESSYRSFFHGLADLQKRHPINIYFKPRGLTGEHELWLTKMVGTTGNWRRVLEHPLRIDLPNPLYVSVSMGSSALIEGLGRGIPGLIVRDFPVRDYTTLDGKALPIGPTSAMLEVVESLCEPNGYQRLFESELVYYEAEVQAVTSD